MQPEQALVLYLQSLNICKQQLGSQHPRTIDTRTRAIHLLRQLGRSAEAATLEFASTQKGVTSDQPAS